MICYKILILFFCFVSIGCVHKTNPKYSHVLELNEYKLYKSSKNADIVSQPLNHIAIQHHASDEEKIILMADEYIYQQKWQNAFDLLSEYKPGLRANQEITDRMIYTALQLKNYQSAAVLLGEKILISNDLNNKQRTQDLLNQILMVQSDQDISLLQEQISQYFYQYNFKAKTEQSELERIKKESLRMPAEWINESNEN